jgi:hypothetical protein
MGLGFRIHQIQQERGGNWSLGWEREIETEIQESRLGLVLFFDATNALDFVLTTSASRRPRGDFLLGGAASDQNHRLVQFLD